MAVIRTDLMKSIFTYKAGAAIGDIDAIVSPVWYTASNLGVGAGSQSVNTGAMSAGFIYNITTILGLNNVSNTLVSAIYVNHDGANYYIRRVATTVAAVGLEWNGSLYIDAGDIIAVIFDGCTAGDDLYIYVGGYKIALD